MPRIFVLMDSYRAPAGRRAGPTISAASRPPSRRGGRADRPRHEPVPLEKRREPLAVAAMPLLRPMEVRREVEPARVDSKIGERIVAGNLETFTQLAHASLEGPVLGHDGSRIADPQGSAQRDLIEVD